MSEPTVFGTAYYPSRTAPGRIVFLGVAGAHPVELQLLAQEIYDRFYPPTVAWSELACDMTAYARDRIAAKWPGHTYWIQVENDDFGYQEYGTAPERREAYPDGPPGSIGNPLVLQRADA